MDTADELRKKIGERADGRCECKMRGCTHYLRDPGLALGFIEGHFQKRCDATLREDWQMTLITAGTTHSLSNSLALCQRCAPAHPGR